MSHFFSNFKQDWDQLIRILCLFMITFVSRDYDLTRKDMRFQKGEEIKNVGFHLSSWYYGPFTYLFCNPYKIYHYQKLHNKWIYCHVSSVFYSIFIFSHCAFWYVFLSKTWISWTSQETRFYRPNMILLVCASKGASIFNVYFQ